MDRARRRAFRPEARGNPAHASARKCCRSASASPISKDSEPRTAPHGAQTHPERPPRPPARRVRTASTSRPSSGSASRPACCCTSSPSTSSPGQVTEGLIVAGGFLPLSLLSLRRDHRQPRGCRGSGASAATLSGRRGVTFCMAVSGETGAPAVRRLSAGPHSATASATGSRTSTTRCVWSTLGFAFVLVVNDYWIENRTLGHRFAGRHDRAVAVRRQAGDARCSMRCTAPEAANQAKRRFLPP